MNIIIILIEKEKQLPITQAERGSTAPPRPCVPYTGLTTPPTTTMITFIPNRTEKEIILIALLCGGASIHSPARRPVHQG